VLDACYSGQAIRDVSGMAYDDNTALLASSSRTEQSSATLNGKNQSAFTAVLTTFLLGSPSCSVPQIGPSVCDYKDGIIGIHEVRSATTLALRRLSKPDPRAKEFEEDKVGMIGYFCEAAAEMNTVNRQLLTADQIILSSIREGALVMGGRVSDQDVLTVKDNSDNLLAVLTVQASDQRVVKVRISGVTSITGLYAKGKIANPLGLMDADGNILPASPSLVISGNNGPGTILPQAQSNLLIQGLSAQFVRGEDRSKAKVVGKRFLESVVAGKAELVSNATVLLKSSDAAQYLADNLSKIQESTLQ